MGSGFNWTCPHCEHHVTITDNRWEIQHHHLDIPNRTGSHTVTTQFIVCPNPECEKYTLNTTISENTIVPGERRHLGDKVSGWRLVPWGSSRTFPDYVPEAIRNDYAEACAIVALSPKAAATLARRAVQGIVRGYWGIAKNTLNQELEALKTHIGGSISQQTWGSIDAVRSVGNIGAHMEKDINIMVDVDPDEAELLIELVEKLIVDTYVAADERDQRHKKLLALKAKKEAEKKAPRAEVP
jgi:hypothetical protein